MLISLDYKSNTLWEKNRARLPETKIETGLGKYYLFSHSAKALLQTEYESLGTCTGQVFLMIRITCILVNAEIPRPPQPTPQPTPDSRNQNLQDRESVCFTSPWLVYSGRQTFTRYTNINQKKTRRYVSTLL